MYRVVCSLADAVTFASGANKQTTEKDGVVAEDEKSTKKRSKMSNLSEEPDGEHLCSSLQLRFLL